MHKRELAISSFNQLSVIATIEGQWTDTVALSSSILLRIDRTLVTKIDGKEGSVREGLKLRPFRQGKRFTEKPSWRFWQQLCYSIWQQLLLCPSWISLQPGVTSFLLVASELNPDTHKRIENLKNFEVRMRVSGTDVFLQQNWVWQAEDA